MRLPDGYVPVALFGKDHWSTLAYMETVMVECAGFEVGFDPRMRQNRRNYRVMWEQVPHPKRVDSRSARGMVMDLKYSTKMKDGSVVQGHDDWSCVQDMANAGFLTAVVEPGKVLHLTPLGRKMSDELRAHKRAGGSFGNFNPPW